MGQEQREDACYRKRNNRLGLVAGGGGRPPFRQERPGGASAGTGSARGGQRKMPGTGRSEAAMSARASRREDAGYTRQRLHAGDKPRRPSSCGLSQSQDLTCCLHRYERVRRPEAKPRSARHSLGRQPAATWPSLRGCPHTSLPAVTPQWVGSCVPRTGRHAQYSGRSNSSTEV